MTLAERIVELLKRQPGLSDRQIADVLFGKDKPQQPVNIACRNLETKEILIRRKNGGNPIGNFLTGQESSVSFSSRIEKADTNGEHLSEDSIKEILEKWLISQGWKVKVAWGHERGIDIEATTNERRWVIEVKGQGKHDQARGNYFVGMLGEILQRMKDPTAKYSIALPDLQRYRNLWQRLPPLAKSRTSITAIFVDGKGSVLEVT
ncbi:MAG: MarR family transcriptional regulator [Chloroflexota bacterium]